MNQQAKEEVKDESLSAEQMAQLAQAALARAAQDQLIKCEIKSEPSIQPDEKPMPQLPPAPSHVINTQLDIKTAPEKEHKGIWFILKIWF